MEQLKPLLISVWSFIRINILDEEILALHLESFARNAAKAYAAAFVCGEVIRHQMQRFGDFIEPETPEFKCY